MIDRDVHSSIIRCFNLVLIFFISQFTLTELNEFYFEIKLSTIGRLWRLY